MNTCRTCLKTPANKGISDLEKGIDEDKKNYLDIMMFCLDITVTRDSKITTNLCFNCYRKIISFYKFKALALKNDVYLKSLDTGATLVEHKTSVYVDENGIKHENSLDLDDYGPSVVEDCSVEFKEESGTNYEDAGNIESDEEPLSVVQSNKCEDVKDETKENAPLPKKRGRRKSVKTVKVEEDKQGSEVCEECGKSVFSVREHSVVHLPMSERRTWQCKACPKAFLSCSSRITHYNRMHGKGKSECDICHKKVFSLKKHKLRLHNRAALRIECLLCARRFYDQSDLNAHMPTHTKHRAFECDICHKTYATKGQVGAHIRKFHLKQRPHQCPICLKGFFAKNDVQSHLRVHRPPEHPYSCSQCGKRFVTRNSLTRHAVLHTGVRDHHCQFCDKSFEAQWKLTRHMVTHTKERRFQCRFCDDRFGCSSNRHRHERLIHKIIKKKQLLAS